MTPLVIHVVKDHCLSDLNPVGLSPDIVFVAHRKERQYNEMKSQPIWIHP